MTNNNFPENLVVTKNGELVQLGDDFETPWGFTIEGLNKDLDYFYGFSRNWKSLDDFLGINNDLHNVSEDLETPPKK
jgi:hypothetical protein